MAIMPVWPWEEPPKQPVPIPKVPPWRSPCPLSCHRFFERNYRLYFVYALDGTVLYVGETNNLLRRLSEHERTARWFRYARNLECFSFGDQESVLEAEAEFIEKLHPVFNIRGQRTQNYGLEVG